MKKSVFTGNCDETIYVSLPDPIWEGSEEIGVGIKLKALYFGKKTGRCVRKTYSCWEDRKHPGTCVGTAYSLIDQELFAFYCQQVGAIVPEKIEAEEL